jgi:FG-GAP repeat
VSVRPKAWSGRGKTSPTRASRSSSLLALSVAVSVALVGTAETGLSAELQNSDARVLGDRSNDHAGAAISAAGDINGDGRRDFVVGAPGNDRSGKNAGAAYVIFGPVRQSVTDLRAPLASGFVIRGAHAGDRAGLAVGGAGDVNSDGFDDLLVGAPFNDATGHNAGCVYIVFGSRSMTSVHLDALGRRGYSIKGEGSDAVLGTSVANAGDTNDDGLSDAIIGSLGTYAGREAAGSAFIVYGKTSNKAIRLDQSYDGFRIGGETAGDAAGYAVSGASDVNSDGLLDVVIGAPFADYNGRRDSGSAYVVFGRATPTDIDLSQLGAFGFRIDGSTAPPCAYCSGNETGVSVGGGRDVNGDGFDDVIVGAWRAHDSGDIEAGSAYVVYGGAAPGRVDLAEPGFGIRLSGANAFHAAGAVVALVKDVNDDLVPDVVIGAPGANRKNAPTSRSSPGVLYLVYADPSDEAFNLRRLPRGGRRFIGVKGRDQTGSAAAIVRGLVHRGRLAVAVGAFGATLHERDASGVVYVMDLGT